MLNERKREPNDSSFISREGGVLIGVMGRRDKILPSLMQGNLIPQILEMRAALVVPETPIAEKEL
jgi:hypothetical protein